MDVLKDKLKGLILMMESKHRERCFKYGVWRLTSRSLFREVFDVEITPNNWPNLEKDGKLFCFNIIHEEECEGDFFCSCTETVRNPRIKVYYLSKMFSEMISVSHFQLWFSGDWRPKRLSDIVDRIKVSSDHIMLFNIDEDGRDPEHGDADHKEFEKEESPYFKRMLDEFKSLICEYVKLAFTDPTSLPPFLLDSEGPTMRLSDLLTWLEESE